MISGFVAYKSQDTLAAKVATIAAMLILLFLAGRSVKTSSRLGVLKYSFGWLIIIGILDVLFTVPFTGWQIFSSWETWLGYALLFLVPFLTYKKSQGI